MDTENAIIDYRLEKINSLYEEIKNMEESNDINSINEIRVKLFTLKYLIMDFKEDIENKEERYSDYGMRVTNNRVSDVKKVFNVIRRIVNREEEKYTFKAFYATYMQPNSSKTGDFSQYSCVWVIAKKDVLDEIDNNKIYYRDELIPVLNTILTMKSSALVVTKNGFGVIIDNKYEDPSMERFDILTGETATTNIDCYLFDDELKEAVYALVEYLKIKDININRYSEDILYDILLKLIKKHKKK